MTKTGLVDGEELGSNLQGGIEMNRLAVALASFCSQTMYRFTLNRLRAEMPDVDVAALTSRREPARGKDGRKMVQLKTPETRGRGRGDSLGAVANDSLRMPHLPFIGLP